MSRILVTALLAITPALADDPVLLEVGEAVPIPETAILVGANGYLQAYQVLDGQGNPSTSLTVAVGLDTWSVTDFVADPNGSAFDPAGVTWTGVVNGQACAGTLHASHDDPYTQLSLSIVQLDGAGAPVTTITLNIPVEAFEPTGAPTPDDPVGAWFKWYCGCDNLNVMCASNQDCANGAGCPSGSGDTCRWHWVIWDPSHN